MREVICLSCTEYMKTERSDEVAKVETEIEESGVSSPVLEGRSTSIS